MLNVIENNYSITSLPEVKKSDFMRNTLRQCVKWNQVAIFNLSRGILLSLVLLLTCSVSSVLADTIYWTGGAGNNDWNTGGNWSTEGSTDPRTNAPVSTDIIHFAKNADITYIGDFANTAEVHIGYYVVTDTTDPAYSWSNKGTGTLTINGTANFGTLDIGRMYGKTTGQGNLTVMGNLTVNGSLTMGRDGAASLTVVKPEGSTAPLTVTLGTGSYEAGYKWTSDSMLVFSHVSKYSGSYYSGQTVADFSAADNVIINCAQLNLSANNSASSGAMGSGFHFRQSATVTLGTNADITTNRLALFSSAGASAGESETDTALPTQLILGAGTTNLNVAAGTDITAPEGIVVAGRKSSPYNADGTPTYSELKISDPVGAKTAVVNIRGLQTGLDAENNALYGETDLKIAFNYNYNTRNTSYGRVDLTNAAEVNANLRNLVIGYRKGTKDKEGLDGAAVGVLILPDNTNINVSDMVYMAYKENVTSTGGPGSEAANAKIYLDGAQSQMTANKVIMGNVWGDDLSAEHAVSKSSIFLSNGAKLTVSGWLVARGEARIIASSGSSTVVDANTGDVTLDSLYVGFKPAVGSETAQPSIKTLFYAQGNNFTIGGAHADDVFYVGAETSVTGSTISSELLSSCAYFNSGVTLSDGSTSQGVNNLTINVDRFNIGAISLSPEGQVSVGNLYMAKNNTVTANTLLAGDNAVSTKGGVSSIEMGEGTNVFNIGTMTIGGRKSDGDWDPVTKTFGQRTLLSIREGGTFSLYGKDGVGSKSVLRIAYEDMTKGANNSIAQVDLSNASSVYMNLETLELSHGLANVGAYIASNIILGNNATVYVNQIDMSQQGTSEDNVAANFSGLILGQALSGGLISNAANNSKVYVQAWNDVALGKSYAGNINLGSNPDIGEANLRLYNGGELIADGTITVKGHSTITVDVGTLQAKTGMTLGVVDSKGTSTVEVLRGGTINIGAFNESGSLVSGALTVSGTATITVDGVNNGVNSTLNAYEFKLGSIDDTVASVSNVTISNGGAINVVNGISVTGKAEITVTNSDMHASTITSNGEITILVEGTDSHVKVNYMEPIGKTNFTITGGKLEVLNNGAGGIVGSGETKFYVKGGTVITDRIDFSSVSVKPVFAFTGGTIACTDFCPEAAKVLPISITITQTETDGASILSPGDAGHGVTRIHGNYVLDSGTILLDVAMGNAIDRDNLYVVGSVASPKGYANFNSANAFIKLIFEDAAASEAIQNAAVFTTASADSALLALSAENISLNGDAALQLNAEEETAFQVVNLVFADEFQLDGNTSPDWDAWGDTHVLWNGVADSSWIYEVVGNTVNSETDYVLRARKGEQPFVTVPEPSTWVLITLGAAGLYCLRGASARGKKGEIAG